MADDRRSGLAHCRALLAICHPRSSIFTTARPRRPGYTALLGLAKIHHRAHLDRANPRAGALGGPLNRFVEVVAVEHVVAAQLLFGFGKWAVRGHLLAVLH